jgi:hypothetical protein
MSTSNHLSRALNPNQLEIMPEDLVSKYFPKAVVVRMGVPGDGSCFFHALCAIQNHEGYLTQPVEVQKKIGRKRRCALLKGLSVASWNAFLSKNDMEHFIEPKLTFDDLRKKFCTMTVWADEPVIRYVMHKLKLNLVFLDERLERLYCGVHEDVSNSTAVILWQSRQHFEPIGRVNALDIGQDKFAIQMLFDHKEEPGVVQTIMGTYHKECKL